MWYWLIRLQEILFLPPYVIYCTLFGRRLQFRCKKCRTWLDITRMASGLCENCHREMISADPIGYYVQSAEDLRLLEIGATFPSGFLCHVIYRRVAERIGQGRVLDVGCGPGYLYLNLPAHNVGLYGIDLCKVDVYRAKNYVDKGDFSIADGRHIPYRSDTFDYVVCSEVLEHLPADMGDRVMEECYRVLKPFGRAIFTVPNGSGIAGRAHHQHLRQFTFKSLVSLLDSTGFQIIDGKKVGLYIPFVSRFLELVNGATGRRLPIVPSLNIAVPEPLSISFFIECRKLTEEDKDNVVLVG